VDPQIPYKRQRGGQPINLLQLTDGKKKSNKKTIANEPCLGGRGKKRGRRRRKGSKGRKLLNSRLEGTVPEDGDLGLG